MKRKVRAQKMEEDLKIKAEREEEAIRVLREKDRKIRKQMVLNRVDTKNEKERRKT